MSYGYSSDSSRGSDCGGGFYGIETEEKCVNL